MSTEKKITIRERKKAQPGALLYFSEAEKQTIIDTVAKDLTVPERNIYFYTCQALGLNPLLQQVAGIIFTDRNGKRSLSIQVMRDGFLTIAHRSGKFAGIESGVQENDKGKLVGWAKVYHKDFEHPVYQEADFDEYYSDRNALWKTKPKTMIKKVAESMALRKAFNVSGVYAPEEMDKEIEIKPSPSSSIPLEGSVTPEQLTTIKALSKSKKIKVEKPEEFTKEQAANWIRENAGGKQ